MNVPPASHSNLDPVTVLKSYIERTASHRPVGRKPLFRSLRKQKSHYVALTSSGIRSVLQEAIVLAGLQDCGYSLKSFRVTGATTGVLAGQDPNILRNMGCWKSCSVFEEHYVHTIPPLEFTDKLLTFQH